MAAAGRQREKAGAEQVQKKQKYKKREKKYMVRRTLIESRERQVVRYMVQVYERESIWCRTNHMAEKAAERKTI